MKKGIILAFLLILMTSFALADSMYPKVYVKMDLDKRVLIRFVDPATDKVEEYKPQVTNYNGVAVTDIITSLPTLNLLVYLRDAEGNIGNPAKIGPFPSTKDINLDYRNGILKEIKVTVDATEETTTEEKTVETTTPVETETVTSTTTTTNNAPETSGITGNAIASGRSGSKFWIYAISIAVIIGSLLFIIKQHQKQQLLQEIPEEKELLRLKKREEIERKAVSKVKTEAKLKEEIAREKKKVAMRLAVEEAELSEFGRDGQAERRREAERYDRKNVDTEKKSFY